MELPENGFGYLLNDIEQNQIRTRERFGYWLKGTRSTNAARNQLRCINR